MRNLISLRWMIRSISKVAIVVLLILTLGLAPAIAQSAQATVALDGQVLFEVSGSGQYSAQDRANLINLQLQDAIQSARPIRVRIEQRNQSPTLLLNDRYLLTVTQQDAIPGSTPDEQAATWAQQIQNAVRQAQAERSPVYLRQMTLLTVGVVVAAAFLHWLLGRMRNQALRSLRQRFTTAAETQLESSSRPLEELLRLLVAIARVGLWTIAALYITNLFPVTRAWSYQVTDALKSSFTSPIISLGRNAYSIIDLLLLAGLLSGLIALAGTLTNLLRSRVLHLAGLSRGGQEVIAILTKYSLITIGTLIVLQIWGLDISSLTILASALGVGIGFGFQDIAKNFGSGLVLIVERPIQIGDFIEIANFKGTVERIGGRSTEIRTLDHVSIIVPNSRFLEEEVINWSHRNPISRLHLPVGVAFSADPQTVRSALIEAAQSHPEVLKNPAPQVFFTGFGESALNFDLLVWTTKPNRQFILKSDLYFRIFEVLKERDIQIPFPQRDLHLRSSSLNSPQLEALIMQQLQQPPNGSHSE
ncbi:mechanosensitive ion channel [Microcoleus sp. FACHB-1515]|uniref:mechanosensitive ion channel family protein n=1 Tax=Cyanophyceae TaxID=3028117 RepID=UPI0016839BC5|nr:mechanosensitive ion channel domain-containing protein [Microcoleus sp. FACHB-1515]MBD2090052.1 mechanosensitive ion channel [Microcoleus sp. FACHB-1515]